MSGDRGTFVRRHQNGLLAALLAALAFAAIFLHAPQVGYTRDEGFYFSAARSYAGWFRALGEDPARALTAIPDDVEVAVIDCLTVWMGNLLYRYGIIKEDCDEVSRFVKTIQQPGCDLIIVTNEVGMGIIPENDMARRFRYLAGLLNQEVGRQATEAFLMVSGLPLALKGEK